MKIITSLTLLFSLTVSAFGQIQIGNDIIGNGFAELAGSSVSLSADGTRVAVGAPGESPVGIMGGQVRIYQLENDEWVQLGGDILGENAGDKFGHAVSISADGNRVAVGAPFHSGDDGQVRVFEFDGTDWMQLGTDILGNAPFGTNRWGESLALSSDGNRVVVGAPWTTGGPIGAFAGYTAVHEFDGMDWAPLGSGISGENESDFFGLSVSISFDGNRIAIGASRYDGQLDDVGYVRVFEFDGIDWVQMGSSITGDSEQEQSGFVVSLSADGNRVASSAPFNDDGGNIAGQIRVFEFDGNDWLQLGNDINGQAGELSGWTMAMSPSGNRVALGAPFSNAVANNAGIVRFFRFNGDGWEPLGQATGEAEEDSMGSGISFSVDGVRVAVGAPLYSTLFDGDGLVRVYEETITMGDAENFSENEFVISPNPTDGWIYISAEFAEGTVQITDAAGRVVLNPSGEKNIDLSGLPEGLYLLQLRFERGVLARRIVKY